MFYGIISQIFVENAMFEKYPNHLDVNTLLKTFKNDFQFSKFKEEEKTDRRGYILKTVYTATSQVGQRDVEVVFNTPFQTNLTFKNMIAKLIFVDNEVSVFNSDKIRNDHRNIARMLEVMYTPDFDKITEMMDWFIDVGTQAGVINIVDKKYYKKSMESHLLANLYDTKIYMTDQNVADVYFNNILQKGEGIQSKHFKKSYINVDVIYLVHSDNTMHPYFKLRLPYFENKKISCVLSMTGDKCYFFLDDGHLDKYHIDQQRPEALTESNIKDLFTQIFENQIKNTISTRLKISKTDLKDLTINDLKEYFVLVEMVNI
jgi:hypothetical protein